jgi:hypothetical protein
MRLFGNKLRGAVGSCGLRGEASGVRHSLLRMGLLGACLLASAGVVLAQDRREVPGRDQGPVGGSPPGDVVMRLKMFTVEDEWLKQPAFTVLMPADWVGKGKIFWRPNVGMPAAGAFSATKPGSVEHVIIYPHIPFVDGIAQSAAQTAAIAGPEAMKFAASAYPEGGSYMGNEVRKAMPPVQYVQEVLIKRGRQDIKNYKVTAVQNMPEWAKASVLAANGMPGMPVKTAAARVRVEYMENGKAIQEDFYVLLSGIEMLNCLYWGAESASSVRAEAGKLEALQPVHQTVLQSVKIDPQWFSRVSQASQMLLDIGMKQQQTIMEISNIVTKTNNEISKSISDSYWNRQKSLDVCHQKFSDYIRGVTNYVLPGGQTKVALPSGYSNVWVNGLGEYVLSNSSSFNPNQHFSGNWQKATQAQ